MRFSYLANLSRSSLLRGLLYLYAAQAAIYLFPLLTLPYLARVLEPHAFGALAVGQALGMYLQLLLEFGYAITGTREVARHRATPQSLSEILWGVLGAKLFLAVPAGLVVILALQAIPILRETPLLALGAYFYAVLSALSPSWFYRGLERMREAAVLEVAARGVALLGIVLLVRSPEDAPLVLFIHGGAAAFASLWGLARLYRELGFVKPSPRKVWASLGMGFSIFPFHAVNTLGLVINPIVLSLFAPPAAVGVFAAAERLARSFGAMLDPLNRAFLPRLAHLAARDPRQAGIFAAKVLVSQGVAGALAAVSVAVVAPWLVHLFFGAGYEEAAGLLRVMAFILLGGALANALGVQWAFAIGQDKLVNRVTFFAMLFQLCLALFLAPRFGPLGMAWGMVIASLVEAGGLALGLWRQGRFPGTRAEDSGAHSMPSVAPSATPVDEGRGEGG